MELSDAKSKALLRGRTGYPADAAGAGRLVYATGRDLHEAYLCGVRPRNNGHFRLYRSRDVAGLHLVSAADGAEQYYTVATNANRYEQANEEGLKLARDLDKKVNRAWTGHPHLRVINNHDDFDTKIHRVLKEISNVLEEVTGQLPECIESEITQTYLVADPDCEVRLRRRDWGGEVVNVHKTKKRISATEVLETERQVSNALYESLLQQADPYRSTIRKTRRSFIWKGQYFEIDFFHTPVSNLTILETKGVAEQENVNFPPFIKVVKDITGNKEYYNYNIALRR